MTMLLDPSSLTQGALPIRTCVGIMLLNRQGLVWVGRRRPKWAGDYSAHIWQMQQGGIEKFEPPRIAALRELREETGVMSVEIIGEHPAWLTYELPDSLLGIALKGRYRGQRQKWFAMRFLGDDAKLTSRRRKAQKPNSTRGVGRQSQSCNAKFTNALR
jgi:putative (di)nucleoside polyphosphate hydrolase